MEVQSFNAGWKINENDEACYIEMDGDDCTNNDDESEENLNANWKNLPDLLLEEIFYYLNIRQRYYASIVCKNWHRVFYLKNVWSNFLVLDDTLCRRKFNYYSGWQPVLDHMRTQNCLAKVGRFMKGLSFKPEHNFNNMFQFMTLLTYFIQESKKSNCQSEYFEVGKRIKYLNYVFPCNMAERQEDDIKLFGTGGELLKTFKTLLYELPKLKCLKIIDLMLERYEAKHLLDEVLESNELKQLVLVNVTSTHCPIMHVGLFFHLKILVISPQNLDNDVLQLLSSTALRHLHIYQNNYSPSSVAACSGKAWLQLRKDNPKIKVHLRVESVKKCDIILQPNAPVYSVTYRAPKCRITTDKIVSIVDMYKYTLTNFGHELLQDVTDNASANDANDFQNRVDHLLVLMARNCMNLTTLMIRDSVSTCTLLMLAKAAVNLRVFYVRKSSVIVKCDWPKNQNWTEDFYAWLQMASKSLDSTEKEISQILGYNWTMLSDEIYQNVRISLPGFSL